MKSFSIALIILAISYPVIAQLQKISEKVNFKENLNNSSFLFSFNNKQNNRACLLMTGKELIRAFVINDSGKILNQFDFGRTNKRIVPLGGYFEDDRVSILFGRDAPNEKILKYSCAFSSGKIDTTDIVTNFEKQSVLSIINGGDNVLFVCVDKKRPLIFIYQMLKDSLLQSEQYDFTTLNNFPYKEKELYQELKHDIVYIDGSKQKSPVLLSSHNKIYYHNDSLILIFDKKRQSELLFLDRKSKICNYKTIEQSSEYYKEIYRFNSYLFNNDLFFVSVCPWGLQLNINDILDTARHTNFKTKSNELLTFKNTNFIKMTGAVNRSDADKNVSESWSQKSFLRQACSNPLIITAEYDSSKNIVLRIGAFEVVSPTQNTAMTAGILDDLITLAIQPQDWSKFIYFQSKLDATTYQHLKGEVQPMTEEKIAAVTVSKKIKPQYRMLLKYNAVNYFVYYDEEIDSIIFNKL